MVDVILFRPVGITSWTRVVNPPWSLLYVSTFLVKAGYTVKIIDQNIILDWKKEILKELKNGEPVCFGVSSLTGKQLCYVSEFSRFVKKHSKSPVVFGGVHPTIFPIDSLKSPFIDIVVEGEGEETFFELVEALEKGKNLKNIKGILYKKNGKVIKTGQRPLLDLNKIPDLPYDLVDIKNYISNNVFYFTIGKDDGSLDFFTSRGCPHNCTFCYNQYYNRKVWRTLNIDKIIDNVNFVKNKFKINNLFFLDDNFFVNKKRVEIICKAFKKEKVDLNWFSKCRIDYFSNYDSNFINLMLNAGLKSLHFGAESGSQRVLNLMRKGIKVSQIMDVNKKLINYKLYSKWAFIAGTPYEKQGDLITTLKLIYKISKTNDYVKSFVLNLYNPYPGTVMYNECLKLGFKTPTTLDGWVKFNKYEFFIPWLSKKDNKLIKDCQFIVTQLTNGTLSRRLALKRLKEVIVKNKTFMPEKYLKKIIDNTNLLWFESNFRKMFKV